MARINEFGQRIGDPLPEWVPAREPEPVALEGRFCRLEPLDAQRHAAELYADLASSPDDSRWTYLPWNPPESEEAHREWVRNLADSAVFRHYYAVVDSGSGRALGMVALFRQDVTAGAIEVGGILFGPSMQRRPISTEAQFLLMRYVFEELGHRRYEWKCDDLNEPSRRTAERLGFSYEGTFRQAVVYKERNRDTAWYSVIDEEWPMLRQAFEAWLSPANFDEDGRQIASLETVRAGLERVFGAQPMR